MTNPITFTDNPAALKSPAAYVCVEIATEKALESWRRSLFSFEWLTPDGAVKSPADLPDAEQDKRRTVEEKIRNGQALEKPILGIGLQDNIEIGSGRAEFLCAAAHGATVIPVHIPQSNESDFKAFLAAVNSEA